MIEHPVTIRRAERRDVPKIGEVFAHSVTMGKSRQETGEYTCVSPQALYAYTDLAWETFNNLARQSSKNPCAGMLVAAHETRIAGFSATVMERREGIIMLFYVDPAYWGTNVAPEMFRATENVLKSGKALSGFLAASKDAVMAQRFYQKMGWHVSDRGSLTVSYSRDFAR